MDQKRIEKLTDQYRKKADRNFRYYQETGEPRYERESRTAEEIADALSVALDHAEEHDKYICLKIAVADLAHKAEDLLHEGDRSKYGDHLQRLVNVATSLCSYRRMWE